MILPGDIKAGSESTSARFLMGRQSLDGSSVCYLYAWDRIHPGEAGHPVTPLSPHVAEAHQDWPYQRLDHILLRFGDGGSPSLGITGCEIAFDQPTDGVWPGDQFGLVANFAFPA